MFNWLKQDSKETDKKNIIRSLETMCRCSNAL